MTGRYVLTGAPGAGKTSILDQLRVRGFPVVEEAATEIVARRQAEGVAEPHRLVGFCDDIAALQRERQEAAVGAVQIFDRSPLCTLALSRFLAGFFDHPVTAGLAAEVARVVDQQVYETTVFFVRPLGFVTPTAARQISYADSLAFELVHEQVYREYGFDLVDVAPAEVLARADFVESRITA